MIANENVNTKSDSFAGWWKLTGCRNISLVWGGRARCGFVPESNMVIVEVVDRIFDE